ncbi:MAG TPA: hypothetical protein VK327_09175 [Candidatus Paceibacterota bacterium]|nr:hypothetical protein [Candidatus Paceibacterota bacterium]
MQGSTPFSLARIVAAILSLVCLVTGSASAQTNTTFQIAGTVTVPADGCDQAIVILCDLKSGEPLSRETMQPFTAVMPSDSGKMMEWLFTSPDAVGRFQFTNIPSGDYIVAAQAWKSETQPTNLMNFRAETIHLLGRREVHLPSEEAANLRLTPPGTNTVQFDQQFGNDDGLLMLSTRPQFADPILAWFGWGTNFISHIIGFNWMPRGKTTVHGMPDQVYASIFMNDNSPGFGSVKLQAGGTNAVRMPIVAGWSDGYKTPPTNLVWLVELLQTNAFNVSQLLKLPPRDRSQNFVEQQRERWHALQPIWENEITLPTGQKSRVADLVTADGYARLNRKRE